MKLWMRKFIRFSIPLVIDWCRGESRFAPTLFVSSSRLAGWPTRDGGTTREWILDTAALRPFTALAAIRGFLRHWLPPSYTQKNRERRAPAVVSRMLRIQQSDTQSEGATIIEHMLIARGR